MAKMAAKDDRARERGEHLRMSSKAGAVRLVVDEGKTIGVKQ
jgi:hypothetical protein